MDAFQAARIKRRSQAIGQPLLLPSRKRRCDPVPLVLMGIPVQAFKTFRRFASTDCLLQVCFRRSRGLSHFRKGRR